MNPSKLDSVDLEGVRECAFLTNFQVMLMLWPKDHTLENRARLYASERRQI